MNTTMKQSHRQIPTHWQMQLPAVGRPGRVWTLGAGGMESSLDCRHCQTMCVLLVRGGVFVIQLVEVNVGVRVVSRVVHQADAGWHEKTERG